MLNEKKVVPKLRQEGRVKVDIITSDDIKIYYTGKFQDFTARYIINIFHSSINFKHLTTNQFENELEMFTTSTYIKDIKPRSEIAY